MTNYYTCQPTIDHESTSTKLTISYKYEIDTTPSNGNIQEAVDEVQNAMLYSIAEVSGLSDCGVEDVWRRRGQRELLLNNKEEGGEGIKGGISEVEGSSFRGRQLQTTLTYTATSNNSHQQHRKLARGSNSIIALSSLPQDTITDLQCHTAMELAQTRINEDSIFGDNTIKVGSPSRASELTVGLVSMAPDDESEQGSSGTEGGSEGIDTINTVGLPSSVTRVDGHTITALNSSPVQQRSATIPNDFVGSGYNSGTAFNYISTQSKPKESTSSSSPSSNNETRRKLQQSQCTVIQGQVTIYTSSTPSEAEYENLQQRILDSLILNVREDNLDLLNGSSGLNVRMYNSDIPNAIELSNGYTVSAAAKAGTMNENGSNPNNYGTTVYLAILISLSVVAIWLLAGFIYTSNSMKKKRQKQLLFDKNGKLIDKGEEEESNHTYYENEPMEMTFEKSCTFDNSEDGLSVEGNGTPTTQRGGGILGMLTPNRKKRVPDEVDMDEEPVVGEESNVDMDVSVFDSDEQTPAHVKAAARQRANENGAPSDVNDSAFYSSNLVPDDLHQPLNDSKISNEAVGNGWGAGMIGQLFGGMQQRSQTHRHTEVETSLHPFEDCEDYSVAPPMKNEVIPEEEEAPVNMVEPTLVVGNVTNEGDRILLNTQQDTDRKNRKAGLLSRFLKRGGNDREVTNDSDHPIGADIEEVHEIYAADAKHENQVSRKPSPLPNQGRETPIYMMQNRSPPRRPIESYRSPSELRYTRSQLSDCGHSEQAQLCGANELNGASPAHITPSPARRNRSNMSSSTYGNKSVTVDDAASNAQSADENSVMPYQNTGVMCQGMEEWKGVQQTLECFIPDNWNPFNWA